MAVFGGRAHDIEVGEGSDVAIVRPPGDVGSFEDGPPTERPGSVEQRPECLSGGRRQRRHDPVSREGGESRGDGRRREPVIASAGGRQREQRLDDGVRRTLSRLGTEQRHADPGETAIVAGREGIVAAPNALAFDDAPDRYITVTLDDRHLESDAPFVARLDRLPDCFGVSGDRRLDVAPIVRRRRTSNDPTRRETGCRVGVIECNPEAVFELVIAFLIEESIRRVDAVGGVLGDGMFGKTGGTPDTGVRSGATERCREPGRAA